MALEMIIGKVLNGFANLKSGLSSHSVWSSSNGPGKTYSMKSRGFSLTELLVTISAVGLLTAILLPSLHSVRKEAKAAVCQSNLRQWGVIFSADRESLSYDGWQNLITSPKVDKPSYDSQKDILLCPMAKKPGHYPYSNIGHYGGTFSAWEYLKDVGSYGWNFEANHHRLSHKDISNIPILFDCLLPGGGLWSCYNSPPKYENMPPLNNNISIAEDDDPASRICINRHNMGINMLFMDYSTRKVGLKELWTLRWSKWFDKKGPWTKAGGAKPEDWPKWMRKFRDY